MNTRHKTWIALAVSLSVSACAVGPDYQRPVMDIPEPVRTAYHAAVEHDAVWWLQFKDDALSALIEQALENNQDIRRAIARVEEAKAGLQASRADLLPHLNASASTQRASPSNLNASGLQRGGELADRVYIDTRNAGLNVSYQFDIWGKTRRASEAARAEWFASQAAHDAVRLSVAAQVARAYFAVQTLNAQRERAQHTAADRQKALNLQRKRFERGLISAVAQHQAEAETATAQADLARLTAQASAADNALQVLLGASPREIVEHTWHEREPLIPTAWTMAEPHTVVPTVPDNLWSDLVLRRPDVQAAEARLQAANARIGQARAAYFPSIQLTAHLGSESTALAGLFTGPAMLWSALGSLTAPIFQGGRIAANVKAVTAREQQALADYIQTVQNAFRETHDSLVAQRELKAAYDAQKIQYAAAQKALTAARLKYQVGAISHLEWLDVQRTGYASEHALLRARQAHLESIVNVYLALGGGWVVSNTESSQ